MSCIIVRWQQLTRAIFAVAPRVHLPRSTNQLDVMSGHNKDGRVEAIATSLIIHAICTPPILEEAFWRGMLVITHCYLTSYISNMFGETLKDYIYKNTFWKCCKWLGFYDFLQSVFQGVYDIFLIYFLTPESGLSLIQSFYDFKKRFLRLEKNSLILEKDLQTSKNHLNFIRRFSYLKSYFKENSLYFEGKIRIFEKKINNIL